jgi:hypothetical protein
MNELGFDTALAFDDYVRVDWGCHEFYAGAQFLRFSGNTTLKTDLVSHGQTFSPGEDVDANVTLDWYRLGYLRHFDVSPHGHPGRLILSPGGDIVLFVFKYSLDGPEGTADRDYSKGGVRLGADLTWNATDRLSVIADAFDSLPIGNTAQVLSLNLTGRYRLWSDVWRTSGVGCLGVAYESLDYEDSQTVRNHIELNAGPLGQAGLAVSF